MGTRTIVTLPGDGIGKVVLPEALRVLDEIGFRADYIPADIGWEFWKKEGNALPQRTLDILGEHPVALFGAITSKPKDRAASELDPSLKGKGYVYYSPIVGLRQYFDLDLCIRPCRSFEGNPLNFIQRDGDSFREPKVDVVVFRQNTEGLYSGVEWTDPPADVRAAMATHEKFGRFDAVDGRDLAISTRIFTRGSCRRINEEAFRYADSFGYDSVTVCEKPNVIRETSGMMLEEARKVAANYPGIKLRSTNIDAQMMWMTKDPQNYGVIVSGNMFGDIVSDGFAGLVGGLGFACSANIGKRCAIFEPTHGSAPKYAAYDTPIVNPSAMILSACMMLDHLGESAMATRVREAIAAVVREGKVKTYDMLGMSGSPDVLEHGAASTTGFTDAIIGKL